MLYRQKCLACHVQAHKRHHRYPLFYGVVLLALIAALLQSLYEAMEFTNELSSPEYGSPHGYQGLFSGTKDL